MIPKQIRWVLVLTLMVSVACAQTTKRRDLNSLTQADQTELAADIAEYLNDPAVLEKHRGITHVSLMRLTTGSGKDFLDMHRAYIGELEAYLAARGKAHFVPLPMWNPSTPIPEAFAYVKPDTTIDDMPAVSDANKLTNLNPRRPPLPNELQNGRMCAIRDVDELGILMTAWHDRVHSEIGGVMADPRLSPSAAIFWPWHAYVDHVYAEWQVCPGRAPAAPGEHQHP